MPMPDCDTCGKPAIGVASSAFGAISWAYCKECAAKPAEPEFMFHFLFDEVSQDGEGLRPEVEDYFTWKDDRYWSWDEWKQWRAAQGPSKPCDPPPIKENDLSWQDEGDVWPL